MGFLAATIKDIAGVTTTLLSVGALMATPERIVRYLQVFTVYLFYNNSYIIKDKRLKYF